MSGALPRGEARTQNQIYEAFLSAGQTGTRWREFWMKNWLDHLREYFFADWKLLPCGAYSKRPLAGFEWADRDLDFKEAIYYAGMGMNIAVKAGPSDLIILDYDSDALKPFDTKTLTMKTPKGYQYYTCPPFDERLGKLLSSKGFDTPRAGMMFALVPLSRTCRYDRGGKCGCVVHDFRYREWVNFGAEVLPFRKVAKELLT